MFPDEFVSRILKMRGQQGEAWLNSIAATVHFCESHWKIKLSKPFNLNFNFVAASSDGRFIVKVCLSASEFQAELKTLQHYNGLNLCGLVDVLEERNVLLLEALHPGRNIITLREESAIEVTCSIINGMRDAKLEMRSPFPTVADWTEGIATSKNLIPFSVQILERVERILSQLLSTQRRIYVLHGDLHHENILEHGDSWKAIDPKGVAGEAEFEIIPFLLNNVSHKTIDQVVISRVQAFSRTLDLDEDRIYAWGLVRSVLAVVWNVEDHLEVSDLDLRFVDLFDKKLAETY